MNNNRKIDLRTCAQTATVGAMKAGNVAVNLSINGKIASAVKGFVAGNKRKGRRDVSELTENLWVSYLRKAGVKLPPLLKKD